VQKLLPLAHLIAGSQQKVVVRKLTVLPKEENGEGDFARKAINVTEQLRAATGIDIGQVAKRLGAGVPPPPPKPND